MIKIKTGTPPPQDDLEQRKKDIEEVAKMKIGKEAVIVSQNPQSWKVTFYGFVKETGMKFKIRTIDKNSFRIWRVM